MIELLIGFTIVSWISIFGSGSVPEKEVNYPPRKPTAYELRTIQQTAKFYPGKDMTAFLEKQR